MKGAVLRAIRGASLGLLLTACARTVGPATAAGLPGAMPPEPPREWSGLIGEYGPPLRIVREDASRLQVVDSVGAVIVADLPAADVRRDAAGRASSLRLPGREPLRRLATGPQGGSGQLRVNPVRPVSELRPIALGATPPAESGSFAPGDLVELRTLDPSIRLDIRYATTNNFLGTRFYDEARAFLQRPAAEALVRVNRALAPLGYGLLVHDGYRPWYVTKMFWDATPLDKRWLVANPAQGSRHNRGSAVDLTLYELATGRVVEMPSTYDESTDRAFYDYPGGTSRQRWHRRLLHDAMLAEGFLQNPHEWWHYDYRDWQRYAIGNVPFDRIGR